MPGSRLIRQRRPRSKCTDLSLGKGTWSYGDSGCRRRAGLHRNDFDKRGSQRDTLLDTVKRVPLRRLGKPEEIADGVLSSIRNDFFNGKVLELDGGLII